CDGAPSTPQHPAAPEYEAHEAPPGERISRGTSAGEDAIRNRRERQGHENDSDPEPGDADRVGVDASAACRVERIEEHRLVLDLLIAMPPKQPRNARVDAVE